MTKEPIQEEAITLINIFVPSTIQWCWRRLLRVPWTAVNPKGNQPWIFLGRTDAEAEAPILWPPDVKNWLIGKYFDSGKDWGQEEKRMTENEMVGWHRQLDGHEFEQTAGVSDGQGGLVCCSSWGHKESDTTEQMNWTEWKICFHPSTIHLLNGSLLVYTCNNIRTVDPLFPCGRQLSLLEYRATCSSFCL